MQTSTESQQHESASASAWASLPTRHGAGQCRGKEQESERKLARRRSAAKESERKDGEPRVVPREQKKTTPLHLWSRSGKNPGKTTPLHRSDLKIPAKNRQTFSYFSQIFCKNRSFQHVFIENCTDFDEIFSEFRRMV